MKEKCLRSFFVAGLIAMPALVYAQDMVRPGPIGEPATKLYRQVYPDGRVVYSDKPIRGTKLDDTLTMDPESKGHVWKNQSGKRPQIAERAERTEVSRVLSIPPLAGRKSYEQADMDVIKAEMLLEDAKRRKQAGEEPLSAERNSIAGGGTRLNEQYAERQKKLSNDVAEAEALLKRTRTERDSLRSYGSSVQ
jgi:hypothetical protein